MSILPPFLPLASTFNCSPTSFSAILPVNASVAIAYSIPEGGTFQVPARNIAYSALPTDLRALCVAQIETKAAQRQLLALVSLSLQVVERVCFLAVGNGGFAGSINRLTSVGYGSMSMSPDTDHHSTAVDIA